MKKIFVILIISGRVIAQNTGETLERISIPTSPASSIIGAQPSEILSPKSYDALETALFSNFKDENSNFVIPDDFALEFSPYWIKERGMSAKQYLCPTIGESLLRNSSFSLASTQGFTLGDSSKSNAIAFGYRNSVKLNFKNEKEEVDKVLALLDALDEKAGYINKIFIIIQKTYNSSDKVLSDKFYSDLKNNFDNHQLSKNDFFVRITESFLSQADNLPDIKDTNYLSEASNLLKNNSNYSIIHEEIENSIKNRIDKKGGLSIEFAYANFVNFPNNQFNFSYVPTQSIWITPTFSIAAKDNNNSTYLSTKLMGVYRRQWYNGSFFANYFTGNEQLANTHDFGIAVKSEFKKLSFQFEIVGRIGKKRVPAGTDDSGNELFFEKKSSDLQYIGVFNYLLTDKVILTYNLGSQFETIFSGKSTLVSLLSVNFGFGGPAPGTIDQLQK